MPTPTVGNIGQELNLLIKQGSDFAIEIELKDENGTPFYTDEMTPVAAMRKQPFRDPVVNFDASFVQTGRLRIELSASATAQLTCGVSLDDDESLYQWDLEFIDNGNDVTIPGFYGAANVMRNI